MTDPSTPVTPRPRLGGGRVWAIVAAAIVVLVGVAIVGFVWVQAAFLSDVPPIPDREALWAVRRSPGMTFLDHNGGLIATRGAKYGARVALTDLPAYVPRAFLAAEDRRFYQHGAVDPLAILRAARRDVTAGRAAEGASTLSQQLARTLFLKPDHTLKRKIQEAILASRLETMLGKDQVLALYLNRTYFGAGAYGLDAAAQTYFGEHAGALTLAQAATLAALPNAPSRLTNDLPAAWARARRVLGIMRGEGWITEAAETEAVADPPTLTRTRPGEGGYSYILDQAAAEADALAAGATDLVVRLTIDPRLQAAGQEAVREVVAQEGRGRNVSQGALVALAPDGAIRAMIGGLDHNASAYNRVTQARRQPGSSFKAFVFGAALERGVLPTDTRQDAPIALAGWTPGNYGGRYSGAVTLQQALARSINTVSVRLALETGPDQVAAFARRCGLKDIPAHPGPSIALGAYEVTLLELAGGYQVFQTGGARTTPYLIESLANTHGEVLFSHLAAPRTSAYDPLYATRLVGMLKTVITGGTGMGANIGRPAAGKTGTSQNWRDAWFVGFTPDLLAGVWVGNDNNSPMNKVTGGELPARIWKRFMTVAEKDVPPTDFSWLVGEPEGAPDASLNAVVTPEDGAYQDQPPAMQAGDAPPPGEKGLMAPDSDEPDPAMPPGPTPMPDNPP